MNIIGPFEKKVSKVGIISKRTIAESVSDLKKVLTIVKKHTKNILLDERGASFVKGYEGHNLDDLLHECDLVLVLGGDGTMLKTASHLAKTKTLILGVNMGNLGFLSETRLSELNNYLTKIFKKEYVVDKRTMLRVTHYRGGQKVNTFLAMNEAVVNQGLFARLIELKVEVDKRKVISFQADGMIIATPTGSSGHSLSAGGPIVHPSLNALILTPICPVTLSLRPIVVPNNRQIKITVSTKRKGDYYIGLTIDGQTTVPLEYGDEIKIRRSSRCLYMARLPKANYYKTLRSKLGWGVGV